MIHHRIFELTHLLVLVYSFKLHDKVLYLQSYISGEEWN